MALPKSAERLLSEIAADNLSGASELLQRALRLFPLIADVIRESGIDHQRLLLHLGRKLKTIQPCMAPFVHLSRYVDCLARQDFDRDVVESALRGFPHATNRMLKKHRKQVLSLALDTLAPYDRLLVHSRSALVQDFLQHWLPQKEQRQVWICESRPMNEGILLLQALENVPGKKVVLVDDARGLALQQVQAVVLGADRISEAFVTNKIGSHALALLARASRTPAFVLAEAMKLVPKSIKMKPEPPHPPAEVLAGAGEVEVFNYYFENTPVEMFGKIITPFGAHSPGEVPQLFRDKKWDLFTFNHD